MKNWKNLFREQILERGLGYCQNGAVVSLEKTEFGYEATVEGSEEYEVEIILFDNEIEELFCTCPHAEEGNHCKHMAAVLYQIERESREEAKMKEEKQSNPEQKLQETINYIPEKELREFLLKLARRDDSIRDRILMEYAETFDEKQIRKLKKEIDKIADQHTNRDGFISYAYAWDYACAIMDFLEEKVRILIDKGYLMEAFALTNYAIFSAGEQAMDDSDGGLMEIAAVCFDCWERIIHRCKPEQKMQMFRWFKEQYQCCEAAYIKDDVDRFFMQEFHEPEMLQQKLELLDALIAKSEKELEQESSYLLRYYFEKNVKRRFQIMKELGYSEQEQAAYQQKYYYLPAVRKLEIEEYLRKRSYDQAIHVLQESKVLDKALSGLVANYCQQLMEIYQKTGKKDAYKKELLEYIFKHTQHNLTYIELLKAECDTEEWKLQREQILAEKRLGMIRYQLLAAEGMVERLLQELAVSGSIFALDQYEKLVKKQFPEKTRDLYIDYVKNQAVHTTNRKEYQSLIWYLKKIVKYPDGKEKVQRIAEEWRQIYKRRPAMMDELKKAGF